jgi:hypothetical protein
MTAGHRRALVAILAVEAVIAFAAVPAHAADADEDRPLELWMDRPLAEGVPAGTELPIGLMVWDTLAQDLTSGNPPFVRIQPAEGNAEPSLVTLVEDWRGHYSGSIPVPSGGMGEFEAGFGGTACDNEGCRRAEIVLPISGVGPPPEAPLPSIAQAQILVTGTPVAGEPFDVSILLEPNQPWSLQSYATPDRLFVQVREPRAEVIDRVEATPGVSAFRYRTSLTLPAAGDFVLQVAEDRGGAAGEVFGASLIPVTAKAAPTESARATESGGPDTELLIVLGFVGVVLLATGALVVAIRRA